MTSYADQINAQLSTASEEAGAAIGELTLKLRSAIVALATAQTNDKEALDESIAAIAADVATLTSSLDANTLADLQALTDRIANDSDLSGSIATLQGMIESNQALIENLQGIDTSFQTTVDALGVRLDSADSLIASNSSAITSLQTLTSGFQTALDSLTGRVTQVETDVSQIISDLAGVAINAFAAIRTGFSQFVGTQSTVVSINGTDYDLGLSVAPK